MFEVGTKEVREKEDVKGIERKKRGCPDRDVLSTEV